MKPQTKLHLAILIVIIAITGIIVTTPLQIPAEFGGDPLAGLQIEPQGQGFEDPEIIDEKTIQFPPDPREVVEPIDTEGLPDYAVQEAQVAAESNRLTREALLEKARIDLPRLRRTTTLNVLTSQYSIEHDELATGYQAVISPRDAFSEENQKVWYEFTYKNIPVHALQWSLEETRGMIWMTDIYLPDITLSENPTLSADQAKAVLQQSEFSEELVGELNAELRWKFVKKPRSGEGEKINYEKIHLMWRLTNDMGGEAEIDAHTGEILYVFDGIMN